MKTTKETQYNDLLIDDKKYGSVKLGLTTSHTYRYDPKRLTFLLSRYKFVSKMFEDYSDVLEIGSGDCFGSTMVAKNVRSLTCLDFDPIFIENAKELRKESDNMNFVVHNILVSSLNKKFDAIYSLDVLEHISKDEEDIYMKNLIDSLLPNGAVILGMPSIESQEYASKQSKIGHINCKTGIDLKNFCLKYFNNVFLFSMNDEVVHTGFSKMAHYLIVLCTNPKNI